jgi:hypothetical protein
MALLVTWERVAFPGLLNFSTDYRTTALFWEMHVGGAALDACLAMAFPFALQALWTARRPWASVIALAVVGLGVYACITTFSRIVFLAVPLGVLVMVWARRAQARRTGRAEGGESAGAWWPVGLVLALFTLLAVGLFPGSGYRGALAALVALALLLPMASAWRAMPRPSVGGMLLVAALAAAGVVVVAMTVPKGAYLAVGAAALTAVVLLALNRRRQPLKERASHPAALGLVAGFAGLVAGVPMVALHWGGAAALPLGLVAAVVLSLAGALAGWRRRPPWPADPMWQLRVTGAMVAILVTVGVFMGGGYLSGRFTTSSSDSSNRVAHWQRALSQLHGTPDWLLGKGLGRFPLHHFLSGTLDDQTGDHRLVREAGRNHLLLTGGKHILGWGEFYRVSQRVAPPVMPAVVNLDLRADHALELHFEVCEKHLLYERNCVGATTQVKPTNGAWLPTAVPLTQADLSRGSWYAPRLLSFSVAVETRGARIELANLRLRGGNGADLLDNGDFSRGMARWYFSSDRHHMPWHTKGLGVHVLFEQGLVGATLLSLMLLVALGRLSFGAARNHELAPPLLAALVGVMAVGLIDSLLDMPRVGLVIYLLLGLALVLQPDRPLRTR